MRIKIGFAWLGWGVVLCGMCLATSPVLAQRWRLADSQISATPVEPLKIIVAQTSSEEDLESVDASAVSDSVESIEAGEPAAVGETLELVEPIEAAESFEMADPDEMAPLYAPAEEEIEGPWETYTDPEAVPFYAPPPCPPQFYCRPPVRQRCQPMARAWVDVDYLWWTLAGYNLPPLVTAAPNGVIPDLANPQTAVLFGNGKEDDDFRSGGRIRMGAWLDAAATIGVEGHYFALEPLENRYPYAQAGDGALSLGRPFVEVAPNFPVNAAPGEAVLLAAFDDPVFGVVSNGRVDVATSSAVTSAGILLRQRVADDYRYRVSAVGGFRFFRLDEGLSINSTAIAGPGAPFPLPIGFTRRVNDTFNAVNQFYGGEFGLTLERRFGRRWQLEVTPKVAVGAVHQQVDLAGIKSFGIPGLPVDVRPGGLLVQPSNTGTPLARASFEREEFAFLPEVDFQVGFQLTRRLRATAGWSALYLSDAVRPGRQIDRSVNGNQLVDQPLVGPVRPQFQFNPTDVWLYGVNVGLEGRF